MSNTYKRPDANYNTETSSKHANRFQEQAINKTALKGRVLDDEFNATIDSLNDLDKRVTDLGVGLFPGSDNPANANNVIYCDGAEAQFGKVTQNLMANNSVGADQLQENSVTFLKIPKRTIDTYHLNNDSVVSAIIRNGAVQASKIKDNAVTEEKIEDGAITVNKLKNASVYGHKIAPNTISDYHLTEKTITASKLDLSSFFIPGEIKFFSSTSVNLNRYVHAGWLDIAHSKSDYYNRYKAMYKADKWLEITGEVRKEAGYIIFDDILGMYPLIITPFVAQDTTNPKAFDFEKTGLSNYWGATVGVDGNKKIPYSAGETAIRIKEENMPSHNHNVVKANSIGVTSIGPDAQDHAVASKRLRENESSVALNLATNNKGSNTPLQWLPPTIAFGGMMYMGQPAY